MCRVVSCGSGDQRWSTKLYLGSGESLEDHHRSCTLGAEPKIVAALGACGILLGLRCRAEQLKAKRQASGPPPVGQKTEMANAYEAVWKQVQQKATEEFIEWERHPPLFVLVGGVPPAKGDFLVGEEEQAVVGDGYAMSVAAQITKHILGASEGWFGVNHPILSKQWPEPRSKGFRLSEQSQVSVEAELAVREGALECRNEFAAEDATEHLDGKKEGVARFDPARAIGGQPTGQPRIASVSRRFPESARSPQQRWSLRWATPAHLERDEILRPGWESFPESTLPGANRNYWASVNGAISTYEPCSFNVHAACCHSDTGKLPV